MRRIGGIFDSITSLDNLWGAWLDFRRGKRRRASVGRFEVDAERRLVRLHHRLASGRYQPSGYRVRLIHEPKRRLIAAAPVTDRIVHHAIHRVLAPRLDPGLVDTTGDYRSHKSRSCSSTASNGSTLALASSRGTRDRLAQCETALARRPPSLAWTCSTWSTISEGTMVRSVLLLAVAMVLPSCSDRPVEEERESHRHLAEQWCADWCPFWVACETVLEWAVDECQASCEGDEWWDWTDECGDIRWEYNECIAAQTCEDARDDPDIRGTDDPCQAYLDELVIKECRYDRPHGE